MTIRIHRWIEVGSPQSWVILALVYASRASPSDLDALSLSSTICSPVGVPVVFLMSTLRVDMLGYELYV